MNKKIPRTVLRLIFLLTVVHYGSYAGVNLHLGAQLRVDTSVKKAEVKKSFYFFHLMRYKNTHSDLMPFLYPTVIAHEQMLLKDDDTPNRQAIQEFAKGMKKGLPVTLDLERWPYWPLDKLPQTVRYFPESIQAFRSVNRYSPIGFYGVPSKQAYQWKNIDPKDGSRYDNRLKMNEGLKPVATQVNIFMHSFYMFDKDTVALRKMGYTTPSAIEKYGKNKPIFAYMWPQYHVDSDSLSLEFIDPKVWRSVLQMLYDRTYGIILWTSNKSHDGKIISWNPNMLWWRTTKALMLQKELVPPFVMDTVFVEKNRKGKEVKWTTSLDTTTQYFWVQRAQLPKGWETISEKIRPSSHYYQYNTYSFIDQSKPKGKAFYRILMADKRGEEEPSRVVLST